MSITWLESVGSTNTEIKNAIIENKPERTVIAAFEQEGGYGRQGRKWSSPQGGLYVSLLLRPYDHGVLTEQISTLALILSLAVKRLLASWGLEDRTQIKWPNDVLVSGGKISGISVELVDGAVCAGIGLNIFEPSTSVNASNEEPVQEKYRLSYLAFLINEFSLNDSLSSGILSDVQREFIKSIAEALLLEVYSVYDQWLVRGFSDFRNEYLTHSVLDGRKIRLLSLADEVLYEGTVCGVDEQGCLMLRRADGTVIHARSGEVHVV